MRRWQPICVALIVLTLGVGGAAWGSGECESQVTKKNGAVFHFSGACAARQLLLQLETPAVVKITWTCGGNLDLYLGQTNDGPQTAVLNQDHDALFVEVGPHNKVWAVGHDNATGTVEVLAFVPRR